MCDGLLNSSQFQLSSGGFLTELALTKMKDCVGGEKSIGKTYSVCCKMVSSKLICS